MRKKDSRTMDNRFVLNRRDAKIMGVGAGLADMYAIDPLSSALAWSRRC
jgi:phage shock protein PspC (stress-responsive transcriptional regulator)